MERRRFVVALLIGLAILLSASYVQRQTLLYKVQAATTNITLYAYLSGWNYTKPSGANPTITVVQGDSISFTIIGGDTYMHRLLVDIDNTTSTTDCPNPGPDECSATVTQSQSSSIAAFSVTSPPGTYFYYCTYHSPYDMVGKFVVLAHDYSVTSNPSSLTINQGSSGSSTITVAGTNGFSGTVNLAASVPSGTATVSMNPSIIMLSPATPSATSVLTIASPLGKFTVTITATSGSTSRSTFVSVSGPDFSISPTSTRLTISQGSSVTLNITVASVNGLAGSVALSATISSGGPPVNVIPASIQVTSSGSSIATLTVGASNSGAYSTTISPGSYNITLVGTMGSLSHTNVIPLTVTSPSSGVGILASPIVIGGIVAAVVIVGIATYALSRRSKK